MKRINYLFLVIGLIASLSLSACIGAAPSLDGSSWNLSSYQNEAGDMDSVLTGSVNTALFQANHVTGIAGCNNYSADYEVDGNDLSFGSVATTRKLCTDPPGIMQQESAFLSALSAVASFDLEGDSLEMSDSQGDTLLTFTRAVE